MSDNRKKIFGSFELTPWCKLPNNLFVMNLSPNEKLVIIGFLVKWPKTMITQEDLAEVTSLSRSSVKRSINSLVKAGLIECSRTISGNRYDLSPLWRQIDAIGKSDDEQSALEVPSEWPGAVVNSIMLESAPIYYLSLHEEGCIATLKRLIEESGERDTTMAIQHVTNSYQTWLRQHAAANRDRKVKFDTLVRDKYSDYLNGLPADVEPLPMADFVAKVSPEKEF